MQIATILILWIITIILFIIMITWSRRSEGMGELVAIVYMQFPILFMICASVITSLITFGMYLGRIFQ